MLIVLLGVGSVAAGACAKAQAKAIPDGPPLAMPAPPPRILAPVDEPLASNPPAVDTPTTAPTAAAPRPATPRPPVRTSEPERQDPVAQQSPAAVPTPARPVPTDTAAERRVRDVLARAVRDLGRVDYQKLSSDGRTQYDQSKRFAEQTEQALKERDYLFATTLADKAAALATALLGR